MAEPHKISIVVYHPRNLRRPVCEGCDWQGTKVRSLRDAEEEGACHLVEREHAGEEVVDG
jgi:hypothetical protein